MRDTTLTFGVALLMFALPSQLEAAGDGVRGTFSIVARDPATGEIGAAVQSKYFNVGHAVPWVKAGVGAVCTQALVNRSLGPRGLALLEAGLTAEQAVKTMLDLDSERDQRQVGAVDAEGRSFAWTGKGCLDWAGQRSGPDYAVQGNILAGEPVITAMEKAFLETRGELAERLLRSLEAAQAAGGDKRGQQSAVLVVGRPSRRHPEFATRYVDLRVDDHAEPIKELRRLYGQFEAGVLVEAHMEYLAEAQAAGDPRLVAVERERISDVLKRALRDPAATAGSLNALAWAVGSAGMYLDSALVAARRAAALDPASWETLDTLGEVLFRLGRRDEAVEVEEKARALAPGQDYIAKQIARFKRDAIPARIE